MKYKSLVDFQKNQLEDLFFYVLRSVYLFEQREIEEFELDFQQMYLLKLLKRRLQLTQTEIATELSIKPFAVTRLIDQLEERKYVTRNKSRSDRRSCIIELTDDGEAAIERIVDQVVDIVYSNLEKFSLKEVSQFLHSASKIEELLSIKPFKNEKE